MIKIFVITLFVGALGVLPVYAYGSVIQPQLDSMKTMYGSMDQTAENIGEGADPAQTETFKQAKVLSSSLNSEQ